MRDGDKGLYLDPGAERMGWAIMGPPAVYYTSGILAWPRRGVAFQKYRLSLEGQATVWFLTLLATFAFSYVVNETVPAVGGGNFIVATQSYLANTSVSVVHGLAYERDLPVMQIGATTVKAKIGGNSKATKVAVRNGVIALFPELAARKKDWIKVFDESDAIGVGATHLGLRNPKTAKSKA